MYKMRFHLRLCDLLLASSKRYKKSLNTLLTKLTSWKSRLNKLFLMSFKCCLLYCNGIKKNTIQKILQMWPKRSAVQPEFCLALDPFCSNAPCLSNMPTSGKKSFQ